MKKLKNIDRNWGYVFQNGSESNIKCIVIDFLKLVIDLLHGKKYITKIKEMIYLIQANIIFNHFEPSLLICRIKNVANFIISLK